MGKYRDKTKVGVQRLSVLACFTILLLTAAWLTAPTADAANDKSSCWPIVTNY